MSKQTIYQSPNPPLPENTWSWNMYGAGLENIGLNDQPESSPVPEPNADQLLVRVDSVGMCFSDVKLIRQGSAHAKLYNRDLKLEPTRLGHEAALTIIKVGENLQDQYHAGQRLAIQPDIYQNGRSTAYGYTIPGGLTQYHLIGDEVLKGDDGAYVLSVEPELGYAETALTEPWACVEASYTQRRRLTPLVGGTMWIVGQDGDETPYTFSAGFEAPATIILTNVNDAIRALIAEKSNAEIIERNNVTPAGYADLSQELTNGAGFDDIVLLDPRSADAVEEAAKLIAFRGTLNMVGQTALDGMPDTDVGRLHYHYTAYIGNSGPDIAASYGEARNRADLQAGGVAVFVGAGGPMGQMHVQRAIELENPPKILIATDVNEMRLSVLAERFGPLAEKNGSQLLTFNPAEADETLHDFVMRVSDDLGADDAVVCVPVGSLMAEAGTLLAKNGMLVLFAGVANGTMAPLNLSDVYLHNAQFTGTSGSALADQATVLEKTMAGTLSPNRSVAAVGGMLAAKEGIEAMMTGKYAGKVVIFPQIPDLPLMSLAELKTAHPDIAAHLAEGDVWTRDAELALLDKFWEVE
jgi:threonine dehydrogenase-like Zn-dependent dehydrogenase